MILNAYQQFKNKVSLLDVVLNKYVCIDNTLAASRPFRQCVTA